MRRLILIVFVAAALGSGPEARDRERDPIAEAEDGAGALRRIAELERSLRMAEPTVEGRERLAGLLLRCKLARVDLPAEGATTLEAIGLLEAVPAASGTRMSPASSTWRRARRGTTSPACCRSWACATGRAWRSPRCRGG